MLRWLRNKWQRDLVTTRERREKRAKKHLERKILCPRCGYDIKGMPDRPCSECGLYIESRWRDGRFAAGSEGRQTALLTVGYLGAAYFLLSAGLLVMLGFEIESSPFPLREYRLRHWAFAGLLLVQTLVALAALLLAIVRRRWLVHGPRAHAIWTEVPVITLLMSTWIVLIRLADTISD